MRSRRGKGHPLGIHRVLDKKIQLPQAATKLDTSLPIYSNEILIEVERLNIDAASFVQMEKETGKDPKAIAKIVMDNVLVRGKQENSVTGSGGMLLGRIKEVGRDYKGAFKARVGDRIATLVSLTLTPLEIEEITQVNCNTHQIDVRGHAILFERTIAATLPKDLPENVALAVYDVAGAPATVNALLSKGKTLVVIGGGGKAGILSCVAGRQKVGKAGKVIAIEPFSNAASELKRLKVCDAVLEIDATDPMLVRASVEKATRGKMADVVINVASVQGTEMSAILSVKDAGKVVFFSMATQFTKVALGAEGIASPALLFFGNGYYPNHSRFAIELLRKHKPLHALFLKRYAND